MISNVAIIIMSGLIIFGIFYYCHKRWSQLDVLDLYIFFTAIYFGGYSFVKALLQDYSKYDSVTIVLVFSQIIIILVLIRVLWSFMPERLRVALEVKSLFEQWAKFNPGVMLLIVVMLAILQIIGYVKFGVISHVDIGELMRIGKPLPYWFSSSLGLVNDFIFCAFIALIAKVITDRGFMKKLWIALLAILLLEASIYGRRSIVNLIIIGTLVYFISQRLELFKLKYLKLLLLISLVMLVFSNVFQAYRGVLQFPGDYKQTQLINPITAALDFQVTLRNIKIRPTAWEFNYAVFQGQRTGQAPLQLGRIYWQGLKNSVPKIFWPNKQVIPLNDIVANLYGLPVIDYAKNNYGFAQAEFGYFSLIVLPGIMIILFVIMAGGVLITAKSPTLLLLLTGFIINYLIHVEQPLDDLFILYRNLALLSFIYGVGVILDKIIMFRGSAVPLSD